MAQVARRYDAGKVDPNYIDAELVDRDDPMRELPNPLKREVSSTIEKFRGFSLGSFDETIGGRTAKK